MEEIGAKTMKATPLPVEYFDLIGGAGFGGLIAIMLGRLRMVRTNVQYLYTHGIVGRRVHRRMHESRTACFSNRASVSRNHSNR